MKLKKSLLIIGLNIFCFISFLMSTEKFDYHLEESPAISWNGLQMFDARMMALGGISLLASDPFSAVINPALIPTENKINLGVSFKIMKFEAFQYWGYNEGVVVANNTLSNQNFHLSGFTSTFLINNIRFSAGWYLSNLLQFPSFDIRDEYDHEQYYSYSGTFSGTESTFFAATALELGKTINIGIKVDYISGNRNVKITDFSSYYYSINNNWILKDIKVEQYEKHKMTIIVPTIGIYLKISQNWFLGTSLVYPFKGNTKRTITRSFENKVDNINIPIIQNSKDTIYRPVEIYLGTIFKIPVKQEKNRKKRLVFAAESKYLLWSDYKYILFGETIPRNLKNTLVLALGLEYGSIYKKRDFFLRLGFRLDPQPVLEPNTILKVFSGGMGLRFGKVAGDLGFSYYMGSSAGIDQNHFILNSTISIRLKGEK